MSAPTIEKEPTPAPEHGTSYVSRPPNNVTATRRLLRGYGPAVAIAAIIALIAVLVPSKAQKVISGNNADSNGNEISLGDNGNGNSSGPGAATGTNGATGTQGQAGTAGKTVTLP